MRGYINGIDWINIDPMKYWSFSASYDKEKKRAETETLVRSGDYLGALKVDGYYQRLIKDEDGNCFMIARNRNVKGEIVNKIEWLPQISEWLKTMPFGTCLLCECYIPDNEGSKNTTTILGCLKDEAIKRQSENNVTGSVIDAMTRYLDSIKWKFDLNGFLFPSRKTKGKMYEECGWRILSEAGKALNLPLVIGSHTMRKSFANIAACVDKSCIDMNAITKVQGLLNHSDQRVTMSYLGSYQIMFDKARIAVSDFVLGKTNVNEIIAGNQYTVDDVFERLDAIGKLLTEKGTDQ